MIPHWNFSLGEGADIIQTLHYYAVGDPLNLLSVFVPERYTSYLYDLLIFLRIYLAGVMFCLLCFQCKVRERYGILAGALAYMFCYWAIFNGARHPFFLTPMIYMPMLILGIEKIADGKRPYVMIAAVCLAACSNFYFFYMLVVLTVVYVLVRLGCMVAGRKETWRNAWRLLGRIVGASVLGACLSGILLVPLVYTFLTDSRMTSAKDAGMALYPLYYYLRLPALLAGARENDYWLEMGIASLATLAVLLLIRERGNRVIKVCLLVCFVFAMFPFFGKMLNGFSYVSNRWCWAIALVFAFSLALMWPRLLQLQRREAAYLTGCCFCLLVLCLLLEYSRRSDAIWSLAIMLVGLLVLLCWPGEAAGEAAMRKKQMFLLLLVIGNVVTNSLWLNAPAAGCENYSAQGVQRSWAENNLNNNETLAIKEVSAERGDDDFFRYTGSSVTTNAGLSAGLSSTVFYWSLANPAVGDYRSQLQELCYPTFEYYDHDGRAMLDAFSAARYYVRSAYADVPVPYGYRSLGDHVDGRYEVFENENVLPLGYTYEKTIGDETWNGLTAVQKQEAMLQAVYLSGGEEAPQQDGLAFTAKSIPYTVSLDDYGVTQQGNSFVVTSPNATATLTFSGLEGCENYLSVTNGHFDGTPEYDLYFGGDDVDPLGLYGKADWNALPLGSRVEILRGKAMWVVPDGVLQAVPSEGVDSAISLPNENYQFYNGRRDFIANFGYSESALTSVTLTFPSIGIYSFDGLEVICQPMDSFPEQIGKLREDRLENVVMDTDLVRGTISLDRPKVLCFSIPYSEGWTAFVDGEETPVEKANLMYMAIPLEAGEHEIELRYETPFLKLGAAVSAAGFAVLAVYVVCSERKRRAQR